LQPRNLIIELRSPGFKRAVAFSKSRPRDGILQIERVELVHLGLHLLALGPKRFKQGCLNLELPDCLIEVLGHQFGREDESLELMGKDLLKIICR
jgi:hypothetical protein